MGYEKEVHIKNKSGLHARPASLFVNKSNNFKSEITIVFNGKEVQAKSILGVMGIGAKQGSKVILRAKGEDAYDAVEQLSSFLEKDLALEDT